MIILIWIISLIILLASILFVYRLLVTSKEYIATDKIFPFKFLKSDSERKKSCRESLSVLHSKIKALEDSNACYEMQFSKLHTRLGESSMEPFTRQNSFPGPVKEEEEEEWEELYYQENERKVQLENELDQALQNLALISQEALELKEESHNAAVLNSKLDARLNELKSRQYEVDTLHKKLRGAAEREKDLQELLNKEIALKAVYDKIEKDNVRLRSELENQERQITGLLQKEKEAARQLSRAKDLQSHFGMMYEEEKTRKIVELNTNMERNRIFSD